MCGFVKQMWGMDQGLLPHPFQTHDPDIWPGHTSTTCCDRPPLSPCSNCTEYSQEGESGGTFAGTVLREARCCSAASSTLAPTQTVPLATGFSTGHVCEHPPELRTWWGALLFYITLFYQAWREYLWQVKSPDPTPIPRRPPLVYVLQCRPTKSSTTKTCQSRRHRPPRKCSAF